MQFYSLRLQKKMFYVDVIGSFPQLHEISINTCQKTIDFDGFRPFACGVCQLEWW